MVKLPLIDYCSELFENVNFTNTYVIGCQHILPSNYIMFDYLFNKGLNPKNTFLIGKSYSTHKSTENEFISKGVHVHKYHYTSYEPFYRQITNETKFFLDSVKEKLSLPNKIIVIDDGAILIRNINSGRTLNGNIVCVEQTSSGYDLLRKEKINYPIINVARSDTKLAFESVYIAKAVVEKLFIKLQNLRLQPKNALIVGGGAIGKNIEEILKVNMNTKVFDKNPNKSQFNHGNLIKILDEFDLIIGCIGQPIVTEHDYKFLKKQAILVSASSSDREFNAFHLRKLLPLTNNPHIDIQAEAITLLNSGFPLNFDGTELEADKNIQLTRALMFSAICLANDKNYKKGFIELDKKVQGKITDEYQKLS